MGRPRLVCSRWWMDWFCWYVRRMMRQHFTVFAVDDASLQLQPVDSSRPLIVYANHPGWWDPIIGMLLCRECFPLRDYYAPIDAQALEKYGIFRKLGYFGVNLGTKSGTADFLSLSIEALQRANGSLWITPEGQFTDPRQRSPAFQPGVAHLASKLSGVQCVPLAIEYVFSQEKLPYAICRLGAMISLPSDATKSQWHDQLDRGLRTTQSDMAEQIIDKHWSSFRPLMVAKGQRHGSEWSG
jgi:1-acyl-sn-glycerol-3-phosphate acyltransferase